MPPVGVPPLRTSSSLLGATLQNDPSIGISRTNTSRTISSITSPIDDVPTEDYVVPFGDDLNEWSQKLGVVWNQIMDKCSGYSTSASYTRVEVLMLSHDPDDRNEDLNLKPEMDKLKAVFRDRYHYGVTHEKIKKHPRRYKRSQAQVNAIVTSWAYKHDGPSTLLIVYFAGHGVPSEGDGDIGSQLQLMGRNEPMFQIGGEAFNKVVWDNTERNLHCLNADVLQIFDCCYAGTMSREKHNDEDQTIEFLAACGQEELTRAPGKDSFTSALIWALNKFADRGGRFTAQSLVQMIKRADHFPTTEQEPRLIRRSARPRQQFIIIHPLDRNSKKSHSSSKHSEHTPAATDKSKDAENQYDLTLRFSFHSWPTDEDIANLGKDLNSSVVARKLPMSRIAWGGITTRQAIARQMVDRLRSLVSPGMNKREREPDVVDENTDYAKRIALATERTASESAKTALATESIDETLHRFTDKMHAPKALPLRKETEADAAELVQALEDEVVAEEPQTLENS